MSQEMSATGRVCAGISGQVEQEVFYDAGLFNPRRSLSLNSAGL
jgi:hypothetical protein